MSQHVIYLFSWKQTKSILILFQFQDAVSYFHTFKEETYVNSLSHPSSMICGILPSVLDHSVSKRLVTCLLAALRANGNYF